MEPQELAAERLRRDLREKVELLHLCDGYIRDDICNHAAMDALRLALIYE